jgi:hypothetical protein
MAEIGTKGFGALPKYCTALMGAFFAAGILVSLIRDLMPKKWARWLPSPMAMSIPFYIGAASVGWQALAGGLGCCRRAVQGGSSGSLRPRLLARLTGAQTQPTQEIQSKTKTKPHAGNSESKKQAIDFWLGSVVMHIWEFFSPDAAEALGPTVGAGLLVGDGLWSIPSSIMAIVGRAPPVCMGFLPRGPHCRLPYCMAFWRGGSGGAPH